MRQSIPQVPCHQLSWLQLKSESDPRSQRPFWLILRVAVWVVVAVQKQMCMLSTAQAAVLQLRAKHFSSTKISSTACPGWCCHVVNWSKVLNRPVAYAVIKTYLICSTSDICSLVSCQYTARAPARNHSVSTLSTFHFTYQLYIFNPLYNLAAPLNSEISSVSNPLSTIFVEKEMPKKLEVKEKKKN